MQNRWFHKIEMHSPGPGKEKKVAWLELFYDLIFVATIIQLGNALSKDVSVTGFLVFAGLFFPIWYTWSGFTFFANRFVVDDFLHRIMIFVQMFSIGALAVCIPMVSHGDFFGFALAYTSARVVLVLLYARAWWQVEEIRPFTARYVIGFSVGVVFWFASAWMPEPWVYIFWVIAMFIDMAVPLSPKAQQLTASYPPDIPHMVERYGLLTIIVLGESFVKVLSEVAETNEAAMKEMAIGWTLADGTGTGWDLVLMGSVSIMITCAIWWIYFDDVAGSKIKNKRMARYIWIYMHLPMMVAVTGSGVAIKKVMTFQTLEPVPLKYRWLLCGTLALAFASVAVLDWVTERKQAELSDKARVNMRFLSAAVMLLIAPVSGGLHAWGFVALVTAVCIAQVIFDLLMAPLGLDAHEMHAAHTGGHAHHEDDSHAKPKVLSSKVRKDFAKSTIRKGTPNELRQDLYFYFMEASWTRVVMAVLVVYFVSNAIFASLYMLDPSGGISGIDGTPTFRDAFYFSVQTMSTIGYGGMSPESNFAHMLVTLEAAFGILGATLITGLMFAKAARPHSSVLFSNVALITNHDGKRVLMFRVGNARGNEVVEATMRLSALIQSTTAEGRHMRSLVDLKLRRETTPVFTITWTVFHDIDEESPFYGMTQETFDESILSVFAIMTGHDSTYAQTTHARNIYLPEDLRFDRQFVDVLETKDNGTFVIDYDKFHLTRALTDSAPESTPHAAPDGDEATEES